MSRPPGLPKTGGRQKGTPNRQTRLLIEELESSGIDPIKILRENIGLLNPADQVKVAVTLLGFLYPRRKASDSDLTRRSTLDALDFF